MAKCPSLDALYWRALPGHASAAQVSDCMSIFLGRLVRPIPRAHGAVAYRPTLLLPRPPPPADRPQASAQRQAVPLPVLGKVQVHKSLYLNYDGDAH